MSSIIRLGEITKPTRIHLSPKKILIFSAPGTYSTTSTTDVLMFSGNVSFPDFIYSSVAVEVKMTIRYSSTGASATATIKLYDYGENPIIKTYNTPTDGLSSTIINVEILNGFKRFEIFLKSASSSYSASISNVEINVITNMGITFYTNSTERSTTSTSYVTAVSGTVNYPKVNNFRVYVIFKFEIRNASLNHTTYANIIVKDMNNSTFNIEVSTKTDSYVRRYVTFALDGFKSWEIQYRTSSSYYAAYIRNIEIAYMYVYYKDTLTPKDLDTSLIFIKQLTIGPGDYLYVDDDIVKKCYINTTNLNMLIEFDPPLPVNKINFPSLTMNVIADLLVIE